MKVEIAAINIDSLLLLSIIKFEKTVSIELSFFSSIL